MMPFPKTTRLDPTIFAIDMAEVICTTGIPAFSSSVVIAAPLRVLVPQVEVNHRIDALLPGFLSHLTTETTGVRKRARTSRSRNKFVVKFADHTAFFHLAHGVERHETIRIFLNKPRVIAAMGDFVFLAPKIVASFDAVRTPPRRRGSVDLVRIAFWNEPSVCDEHHSGFGKIFDAGGHGNRFK